MKIALFIAYIVVNSKGHTIHSALSRVPLLRAPSAIVLVAVVDREFWAIEVEFGK